MNGTMNTIIERPGARKRRTALLAAGFVCAALAVRANNLQITNVVATPLGGGRASVEFDLSWENSWRDAENFDAAWVFLKVHVAGAPAWRHVTLAAAGTNATGFSAGDFAALEIVVPSDRKGALIQRATTGAGAITSRQVRVVWDLAADGVSSNAALRLRALGIEMVYVPAGPFYVGQNTPVDAYDAIFPVTYINSTNMALATGAGAGTIAVPYTNRIAGLGRPKDITGTFNTGYPNGYRASYVMKHELTQGQFADFLNMISRDQARMHMQLRPTTHRLTITGAHPGYVAGAPHRAMVFSVWEGGTSFIHGPAYWDWAGLRPMTEMEYEKAARGPGLPVDQTYAWGGAVSATYTALANDGTALEAPGAAFPNANHNAPLCTPDGPVRAGAFAGSASSRTKAGAGYYGIMELSGNVTERVVPTGGNRTAWKTPPCSFFSGQHGDGELDGSGYANVTDWPNGNRSAATTSQPFGHKGGSYNHPVTHGWIGNRNYAAADYTYTAGIGAGRGVRTAP